MFILFIKQNEQTKRLTSDSFSLLNFQILSYLWLNSFFSCFPDIFPACQIVLVCEIFQLIEHVSLLLLKFHKVEKKVKKERKLEKSKFFINSYFTTYICLSKFSFGSFYSVLLRFCFCYRHYDKDNPILSNSLLYL